MQFFWVSSFSPHCDFPQLTLWQKDNLISLWGLASLVLVMNPSDPSLCCWEERQRAQEPLFSACGQLSHFSRQRAALSWEPLG